MKKIGRRSFLQQSLAGSAAAAVLPATGLADVASAPSPNASSAGEPLKISIMSYAFHGLRRAGRMDVFGYLESSRYRYGLRAADLWNGFLDSTEEPYIRMVREALDERELALASLTVDQAHVWDDDPDVREGNYRNALAHLNAARLLRPRFVRIDAGGRDEAWSDVAFDHIVSRFREYARYAQEHGFKVGAENHWGPEKAWHNLRRLYEAVDHPGFGLSCHLGAWEGTEEEIRRADREVAPWVCHTHIDWNTSTGPLLEERLGNLWKAGYEGYYSVEHHTGEDEYSEVAIQLAHVRRMLERFEKHGVSA